MKKRILSMLLTLLMVISVFPISASAAESASVSVTENENQSDGVILRKSATPKADGSVDISIEAYTTGLVSQTTVATPTDIVLVLDMSGSMSSTVASSTTTWTYTAVNGEREWDWGYNYGYFSTNSSSTKYYVLVDGTYREVARVDDDSNGYYYYRYYDASNTAVYVYPIMQNSGRDNDQVNSYPIVQFYRGQNTTQSINAITALKTAVAAFIETTRTQNAAVAAQGLSTDSMHRIAVVKFADDSYYNANNLLAEGNHRGAGGNSNYNYTELVKNLTVVDSTGATTLTTAVNNLNPGGATAVDYGMNVAKAVLDDAAKQAGYNRNKVVIVFSDGQPNHSDGFDSTVANTAIGIANGLKLANTKVYSLSMASGSDPANTTSDLNKFFHYMSSNYPSALNMTTPGANGNPNAGYYYAPTFDLSLTQIFESIAQQIETPTISLDETTQIVDTMSAYFTIPNGASSVTVQTADRTKTADGWDWNTPAGAGLNPVISGKTVQVQGFDFDENFISDVPRTKGGNDNYYGTKLILTINVQPDYSTIDGNVFADAKIPTNDGTANVLKPTGVVATVDSPTVTANTVTYKYTVNGANETTYATYYRLPGAAVTKIADISRPGHTFSGWSTSDVTLSGDSFTMPQKNVVFTGNFTANTHSITYKITGSNPGVTIPSDYNQTGVAYGTTVTVKPDLSLTGYTFTGWKSDSPVVGVGDAIFTMPDHNVELYGYFEPNSGTAYTTIHYTQNLDGTYSQAEAPIPGAGTTGTTVQAAARTYTGFTRDDSVTNAVVTGTGAGTYSALVSGTVAGDGSLVLRVFHKRNQYTVTYAYDGSYPASATAILPATETFYHGQTVTIKGHAAQEAIPDHTFTGWHTAPGAAVTVGDADTSFTMPIGNVTLWGEFAKKTDIAFTIEHYLQNADGSWPTTAKATDTSHGTAGTVVQDDTYKRTFTGYTYKSGEFDGTTEGTISESPALVLKLYYTIDKYDVTYIIEGGDYTMPIPAGYNRTDVAYGTSVTVEPDLSATGYTFSGWTIKSPTSSVIKADGTFDMPASNVVLVGHFHANTNTQYHVEYYWQNVEGDGYTKQENLTAVRTATTGTTVDINDDPYKNLKQTFNGFNYVTTTGTVESGVVTGDGSLTLKLYYDRLTYHVEYAYDPAYTKPSGAPEVPTDTKQYRYGAEVTIAADLTMTNYEFIGWYTKTSGAITPKTAKFDMPIPQNGSHVTLYGYFVNATDVHYTVNHYLEDPNNPGTYIMPAYQSVRPTGEANTPVNIEQYKLQNLTGYAYHHYTSNITGDLISQTPELVLNLYYDLQSYAVTYTIKQPDLGETVPASYNTTERFGTKVAVKDPLTAPVGYTFSGWSIASPVSLGIDGDGTFTMPNSEVRLEGSFIPNNNVTFKIEYYWQNADPTNDGYTLKETDTYHGGVTGQSIDIDTTHSQYKKVYDGLTYVELDDVTINGTVYNTVTKGTVAGDGSLVLRLYYNRNTYKVKYQYEAGVPSDAPAVPEDSTAYRYGQKVTVSSPDPALEHYQFIGWYSKQNGTVTGEITEFEMPIPYNNEYVILYGDFRQITGVTFKVHHYLQNAVGSPDYPLEETDEINTGVAGEIATGRWNNYVGYTRNEAKSAATISGTIKADNSLELHLYYDLVEYDVVYVIDGENPGAPVPAAQKAIYNQTVTVEPDLSYTDYTFTGWTSTDPVITEDQATFSMPAKTVTLVGKFSKYPTYKVEYYLQDKTNLSNYMLDTVNSHSHSAPTGTPVEAHIHVYEGYTENKDHAERMISGNVAADSSLVLKVYYKLIPYEVEFRYEDTAPTGAPALPATATYYIHNSVPTPAVSVAGYSFDGWRSEQLTDAVVPGQSFTMPAKNVVLVGKFTAGNANYTIEHYLMNDDGLYNSTPSYTESKTGLVGDSVRATVHQDYLDAGAELDGDKIRDVNRYTGLVAADNSLVLQLFYKRTPVTVVYHYEGTAEEIANWPPLPTDSHKYYVGATVTAKATDQPANTNLTFEGWYSHEPAFQVLPGSSFTMPRMEGTNPVLHLYGRWVDNAPKVFTVKYFIDGVEQTAWTATYPVGQEVQVRAKIADTAQYTYSAWTAPVSATAGVTVSFTANGFTMNVPGEVHIKCISEKVIVPVKTYTVTYYIDGMVYWSQAYEAGQQHVMLDTPTMALGQFFSGWSAPRTTSGAVVSLFSLGYERYGFNMPAADVVIYASTSWMPIPDGALKIKKVVDAPDDFIGGNVYTFNIYRLENNVKTLVHVDHVVVDPATGKGESSYIMLPKGTNYIVEEVGANVPGYTLETVLRSETGMVIDPDQTIRVTMKLDPTVITFTNTYEEIPLETTDHFGYIIGYPDGTVRPEGNITRAEVATIFFRLLTDEKRAEYWAQTNSFTDVAADAWYNNAISTLANAGILDGYGDGTFRPGNEITRAELVKIAMSFYGKVDAESGIFNDTDGHWASAFINAAAELGFINGYGDGTFQPNRPVTRAEAMKIINRTLDRKPDKDHLLPDMIIWVDNANPEVWYYAEVQEATNSHTYTDGGLHEIWETILPIRNWAELEQAWSAAHNGQN